MSWFFKFVEQRRINLPFPAILFLVLGDSGERPGEALSSMLYSGKGV